MGITFSTKWTAVRQRVRRLPKIAEGVADAQRKRDAHELVSRWRFGIENNTLGLEKLRPLTRARKVRLGYRRPSSPLYGLGLEGARTYIKGMRVFRKRRGYSVRMINGRHHKSKLPLSALFVVHEYGATTRKGVRIPPRPAMQKAYAQVLRRLKSNDPAKEFGAAVNEYIRTGKRKLADIIARRAAEAEARNV